MVHVIRKHNASDFAEAAALVDAAVRWRSPPCERTPLSPPALQAYDALLVQHEFGIFGGVHGEFVLELLSRLTSTPYLITLHTTEQHASPQRLAALGVALAHSGGVVTMAEDGCDVVGGWASAYGLEPLQLGGGAGLSCTPVTHGVPEPLRCPGEWHRVALGLPPSAFLILSGGLLGPGKGQEALIAAMPTVLRQQPDAVLLIVGAPHPSDSEGVAYARRLWAAAAALPFPVRARILFAPSYLPSSTLQRLYTAAHVFVAFHSSRSQRSSGTLAAAVAAGALGVATPFPAATELLGEGRGVLVPFDRPDVLATSLGALAAEPERCVAMGQLGAQYMARRTWRRVGAAYANLSRAAGAHGGEWGEAAQPGWLPQVDAAPSGRLGHSCSNGVLRAFTVSNPGWVDGVGPGWAAVDTWAARARRGWGEDAVLLKGAFVAYEDAASDDSAHGGWLERGWQRLGASHGARTRQRSLRLFEGAATRTEPAAPQPADGVLAAGSACLLQRWSGGLPGYPWALAEANRTLCLQPRSDVLHVRLSVRARLLPDAALRAAARGAGGTSQPLLPPSLRLSSAVDQLSSSAGDVAYFSWRLHSPSGAPMAARGDAGPIQLPPSSEVQLVSADSRGCSTQLRVKAVSAAASQPARHLQVQLDGTGRPHAVVHTFAAAPAAGQEVREVAARLQLRWTAHQPPGAPSLCDSLVEETTEEGGDSWWPEPASEKKPR